MFKCIILEISFTSSININKRKYDNGKVHNSSENIVKMSLSKSDVNGMFQFSKVTLDKSKETMDNTFNSETFLFDNSNFKNESIQRKLEVVRCRSHYKIDFALYRLQKRSSPFSHLTLNVPKFLKFWV